MTAVPMTLRKMSGVIKIMLGTINLGVYITMVLLATIILIMSRNKCSTGSMISDRGISELNHPLDLPYY